MNVSICIDFYPYLNSFTTFLLLSALSNIVHQMSRQRLVPYLFNLFCEYIQVLWPHFTPLINTLFFYRLKSLKNYNASLIPISLSSQEYSTYVLSFSMEHFPMFEHVRFMSQILLWSMLDKFYLYMLLHRNSLRLNLKLFNAILAFFKQAFKGIFKKKNKQTKSSLSCICFKTLVIK